MESQLHVGLPQFYNSSARRLSLDGQSLNTRMNASKAIRFPDFCGDGSPLSSPRSWCTSPRSPWASISPDELASHTREAKDTSGFHSACVVEPPRFLTFAECRDDPSDRIKISGTGVGSPVPDMMSPRRIGIPAISQSFTIHRDPWSAVTEQHTLSPSSCGSFRRSLSPVSFDSIHKSASLPPMSGLDEERNISMKEIAVSDYFHRKGGRPNIISNETFGSKMAERLRKELQSVKEERDALAEEMREALVSWEEATEEVTKLKARNEELQLQNEVLLRLACLRVPLNEDDPHARIQKLK
eukprot:TRINITY_DN2086_c0_g1_i1.p1 TRINITY_DN2086_c0_g1~~TRINITY_DN2086_c0_g1_i1.p1  ORF type:complete len:299 (-),score=9.55 TRINITY_DN2086_c0_g1_i1:291-1187(-)